MIAPAEASSNLARFDGVRYGHRCAEPRSLEDLYTRTRAEGFGAEVRRRILVGTYALSAGYYDAYYLRAQRVRRLIANDFAEAFKSVDLIAGPTAPTVAFKLGEKSADPLAMYAADVNTVAVNLAGLPAISLPAGFSENLPVGLQLIAPAFAEARLLNAAHQLQQVSDWHTANPERAMTSESRVPSPESRGAWQPVIGLEIHAQLSTQSKLFSGASTAYGAEPNTQAERDRRRPARHAAGAESRGARQGDPLRPRDRRDRSRHKVYLRAKTTFIPICRRAIRSASTSCRSSARASLPVRLDDGRVIEVEIQRAHLEEDAGKSLHDAFHAATGIDLNRAGTPLLEIVSAPVLHSAAGSGRLHAHRAYARALARHLRRQHAGRLVPLRCERIGAPRPATSKLGTRTEIKNVNSFRFVEKAIEYEIERQIRALENGETHRAGDAAVRSDAASDAADAQQGDRRRLPLFPRPRPAAARGDDRGHRRGTRGDA